MYGIPHVNYINSEQIFAFANCIMESDMMADKGFEKPKQKEMVHDNVIE